MIIYPCYLMNMRICMTFWIVMVCMVYFLSCSSVTTNMCFFISIKIDIPGISVKSIVLILK